jgi:hypothetical protein
MCRLSAERDRWCPKSLQPDDALIESDRDHDCSASEFVIPGTTAILCDRGLELRGEGHMNALLAQAIKRTESSRRFAEITCRGAK